MAKASFPKLVSPANAKEKTPLVVGKIIMYCSDSFVSFTADTEEDLQGFLSN